MTDRILFSDLGAELHPALLQALTARGYEAATPVQAAVIDPAARGRDLMVSSQTGSGKTIAFGAALASTLLDTGATEAPARVAGAPRALVIVPTRELAAQVRDELGWLLATTGLRLGSFTGGTAVSGDLRTLHRGVDLAIGTPGRLVDLMRREKLSLGRLEIVVLDEADEMLDLGFREDLETLLGAAPVERRTLLLSATMPSEIRALARRFQRDAMAIDPRHAAPGSGGRGPAAAHDDITYVAHLIAGGDHLAAVVNLLRASPDARAIVFCTTRDSVGALHRELVARGFAATAISGERAQAERDRALDQVRQGEARILVATNVAARGIHLPDVDLIVHADLPLNAESLTHRSGRTGRAGRKGTAVLISNLAERRKAERLLAAAQVRVPWTTPPSAKQIAAAARAQLIEGLLADVAAEPAAGADAAAGTETEVGEDDLLAPFQGKLSIEDLARRLLARELERLPTGEKLQPVPLPTAGGERGFGRGFAERPAQHRTPGDFARAGVRFRVNLGGKDQADPRWLLPLICRRGGVTRREVGAIRIGPNETIFEIAGDAAAAFAASAAETDPRAPHVRLEPVDGAPPDARPHNARPHVAKPHSATPYVAKPHTAEPDFAKPYVAKPHSAKPYVAKPYVAKPYVAKADSAKPEGATPHPAKPHAAKPHVAKAHVAKPHVAKAHVAKPHAPRPHAGPAPAAGTLGGERPYKRPHAARPDRFQPKPPHSHPAGKRRA